MSNVEAAGMTKMDWFRQAQHRKEWVRLVLAAHPKMALISAQEVQIKKWGTGA